MRRIMNLQAKVDEEDVLGVRAPGAKPGYNTQYEVREEQEVIFQTFDWSKQIGFCRYFQEYFLELTIRCDILSKG